MRNLLTLAVVFVGMLFMGATMNGSPFNGTSAGSSSSSSGYFPDGGAFSALSYTATQASGSNALAFSTSGARLDLGAGANDYLKSDGTDIVLNDCTTGAIHAFGFALGTGSAASFGMRASGSTMWLAVGNNQKIGLQNAGGTSFAEFTVAGFGLPGVATGSLPSCGSGFAAGEGKQAYDTTTHTMKFCNGTAWTDM